MKLILVYNGLGVDRTSFDSLRKALASSSSLNAFAVREVNSATILHEDWEPQTALFVMPGGRDLPYHRALKGAANQRLRRYIENGGKYLGICAGAYYGCRDFQFEKGTPLEMMQERELAFFPGTAIGAAYGAGQFDYRSQRGARLAQLGLVHNGKEVPCYFNGGCYFVEPQQHKHVDVLAHYSDLPSSQAAILSCRVGKGQAILSGVHPEIDSHVTCCDPYLHALLPKMHAVENERQWLWHYLIDCLALNHYTKPV